MLALSSNMARGVIYQSRKRTAKPCVSRVVVSGTLSRIWEKIAPDTRIKRGGKPAERRFPKAISSPQANAAMGASAGPTEAMPSVAKRDALKFPPIPNALYITIASGSW